VIGDDAHRLLTKTIIELFLQKDDARRPVGIGLVIHAVIGDQPDHRTEFGEPPDFCVDGTMEGVRFAFARPVGMLDQVR